MPLAIVPFLVPAAGLVIAYTLVWSLLQATQDKAEPSLALDTVPFLEPIWAFLRYRRHIWLHIRDQCSRPIYTIRLPWLRFYVINDSSLITAVDRQARILSFAPIEAKATAGVLGTTEATNTIMRHEPASNNGHFATFHRAVRPALGPGAGLDAMVDKALKSMHISIQSTREKGPHEVGLFTWVRHHVLLSTTEGEYGPGNPFKDPEFEHAWFKFLPGVPLLASGMFPSLLARASYRARETLADAFETYFARDMHLQGSAALLARMQHGIETGLPAEDRARGEVGSSMALVNNTVPSAFWVLYHIFSDQSLLRTCRQEVESTLTTDEDGIRTMSLARVLSSCCVLNAVLLEVFRYYGIGTVLIREVVEDHRLNNAYLLKKGGFVIMPNVNQHFSTAIWGPDVHAFNPQRFLNPDGTLAKRHDPAGLRVFGGGALLCPGRHFANSIILAFVAQILLQFDILPVPDQSGSERKETTWSSVGVENTMGLGVAKVFLLPEKDPLARLKPRTPMEIYRVS